MPTTQARTQIRHQRILDAALKVFSDRGYSDAGVDDIASAAETSKGGVYFHFPGKQAIFLALLDWAANTLYGRIEERVEAESDPMAKMDAALQTLFQTFAGHRSLARLFLIEALGAGPEFYTKMTEIHSTFIRLIQRNLDEAVSLGVIAPLDTEIASLAWFGALNQVVIRWILSGDGRRLEDDYPQLRALLVRSIGAIPDGAGK